MKKLFFLSAMIGLMAGTAAAIEIYSCNTVGVQRVAGKTSEVSVPVPFVGIGGQNATLKSLLYIDNLSTGKNIKTCQGSKYGFYSVWTIINEPSYGLADYVGSDLMGHAFDGGAVIAEVPRADQCVVPIGVGIKVDRKVVSNDVYIMGEYTDKTISTTINGNSYTYLVNPLNKPFSLDQKLTKGDGVNYRDQIIVTAGISTKTYYFDDNGANDRYWYYNSIEIRDGGKKFLVPIYERPEIPAGGGFVYWRRVDSALTFAW